MMLCPQCKIELTKTGMGLQTCSKCHHLFRVTENKSSMMLACAKCAAIGDSIFAEFKVTLKEIEHQFCKRKIIIK